MELKPASTPRLAAVSVADRVLRGAAPVEFISEDDSWASWQSRQLAKISKSMRRDRELAFYGAEDLTPSDFYTEEDAQLALQNARFVVDCVYPHII